MKTTLFLFLTFLLSPVFAASPVWLVEHGDNQLFLAGTVHVLRPADYPLPAAFDEAYSQSQILVFETDIKKSQGAAFRNELMQAITLPENKTLLDILSKSTLAELDTFLQARQLSLNQFLRFKPSMVAMTLTLLELKKIGVDENGVDQFYFKIAGWDGKTTLALESLQQQIEFLANMGEGLEDLLIKQTMEDVKTLQSQFSDMISSWRAGDTKQLEALFIEPMRQDFAPVYQQLLVDRNLNWIPQIVEYLKTQQTEMVLVGSAHLLGEDGLLHLLKEQGYKISQLD